MAGGDVLLTHTVGVSDGEGAVQLLYLFAKHTHTKVMAHSNVCVLLRVWYVCSDVFPQPPYSTEASDPTRLYSLFVCAGHLVDMFT